jgi:hypothetical protein
MPKQTPKRPQYDLKFLPQELLWSCQRLIESYHALHSFASLPDILWRAGVTDFVGINTQLEKAYAKAAKLRRAKRANGVYLQVASALLAVEILSQGLFRWSSRFPAAGHRASKLIQDHLPGERIQLRDIYLREGNFIRHPDKNFMSSIKNPPPAANYLNSMAEFQNNVANHETWIDQQVTETHA